MLDHMKIEETFRQDLQCPVPVAEMVASESTTTGVRRVILIV